MVLEPFPPRQDRPVPQCPRCGACFTFWVTPLPEELRNALLDHAIQLDHTLSALTTQVHDLKACIEEVLP